MAKSKDLSEFDKGKDAMASRQVRASSNLQLLWDVPSLQWLVAVNVTLTSPIYRSIVSDDRT